MIDISVIIPARNEPYLQNTVDDLFSKAENDIEVIVVLDGYWPEPPLNSNTNLKIAHHGESRGMRAAINTGARMAKGAYLMKCDAHCCFDRGFDVKLMADCRMPDWVVVPRRYVLDVETWDRTEKFYEFEYVERETLKGRKWPEFADRVDGEMLCSLMTFQGSCWFMHRGWFTMMGGLDEVNFAGMGREAQEVSLYAWLCGGRCVLTRNTWYAHWDKPKEHVIRNPEKPRSIRAIQEKYPEKSLEPLIERFAPVPGWETQGSSDQGSGFTVQGSRLPEPPNREPGTVNGEPCIIKDMNRSGLYRYFASLGFHTGAEIGVQRGRNAAAMMENIPGLKLYLVDPYRDYELSNRTYGEKHHAKFRDMARRRMEGADVVFIEKFSEDAVRDVPDNSLDFVYIDGMHWYDFVMLDIVLWGRKVREGGIISGHDYVASRRLIGVKKAVDHYVAAHDITPLYLTDIEAAESKGDKCASWFFCKPSADRLKGETVNCANR